MASYTTNLNLEMPTVDEKYDVLKVNQNWQKIDDGYGTLNNQMAIKTFAYSDYAGGNVAYPLALAETPGANSAYFVIFKHYTSSTSFVVDIYLLSYVSGSPYMSQIVKNSSSSISNVTSSGNVVTVTFSGAVYVAGYSIKVKD